MLDKAFRGTYKLLAGVVVNNVGEGAMEPFVTST